MHLLVIDDNSRDIQLLREAICESAEEVEIHAVGDAERAFAFLARQGEFAGSPRPSLIILDLDLPGIDGAKALAVIKGTVAWSSIPVIIHASSSLASERDRCIRLGALDHQVKPTTFDGYLRLSARILELLARRGGERPPATASSGEWRVDI